MNRQMLKKSKHDLVGPEHVCVGSAEDICAQYVDKSLTRFVITTDEDRCIDYDVKSFGGHVPVGVCWARWGC